MEWPIAPELRLGEVSQDYQEARANFKVIGSNLHS